MSHISRINAGIDMPAAIVAAEQRRDAALLARHGPLHASPEHSALLLRALRACWPTGHFDEFNVACECERNPELRLAVRFLAPGRRRRLTKGERTRVARWILAVEARDIEGLRLMRDRIGWCSVVEVRSHDSA